jgi:hypothetical protein
VTTDPDRRNEAWIQAQRQKVARRYRLPAPSPKPPAAPKRKPPTKQPFAFWARAEQWFHEWIYERGKPKPRSQEYTALVRQIHERLEHAGHDADRRTVQRKVRDWLVK